MSVLHCGLLMLEKPGGLGTVVAEAFMESGCTVQIMSPDSAWDFRGCDFVVTYGPMQSLVWVVFRLTGMMQVPPLVVWFTEPTPKPTTPRILLYWASRLRYALELSTYSQPGLRWIGNRKPASLMLQRAGRLRALGEMLALEEEGLLERICVFSDTNRSFLEQYALPVSLIPMGCHRQLGERLTLERDIDVVFLGSTRDRRRKGLIRRLEEDLAARGFSFIIKDGSPERGYAFGKERTILLNRSKIMLNIMRQPWDDPVFRFLLAAPNGAMLLSEKLWPTSMGPCRPGEHFVMTELADMVGEIEFYLSHENERRQITESAYNFVTTEFTMGQMATKIIYALGY